MNFCWHFRYRKLFPQVISILHHNYLIGTYLLILIQFQIVESQNNLLYARAKELESMSIDLTIGGILDRSATSLTEKMVTFESLGKIFDAINARLLITGNLKVGMTPENG